jgi:hypothetical protein
LSLKFHLSYSEIQELTKIWLDEVYNLRGITPLTKPFSVEELVG